MIYDVVIVGAGPAGMTAAIYALRNNMKVALIESNVPGGVVVNTAVVENYPGFKSIDGPVLAYSMFEQVSALGVEYFAYKVTDVTPGPDYFTVAAGDETIKGRSVILASGTKQRKLDVPGEEKYTQRGISWCAICDGALYRGEDVAVIGGGNSAFEETIYLANLVKKIYLVHRREGFRADLALVDKVRALSNVEMLLNYEVKEFFGHDILTGLYIKNNATGQVKTLNIKGCFEFVGTLPSTDYLKHLNILADNGYIKVNHNFETTIPGLLACGDVVDKEVRQIATAINDGAIAALRAIKYLS